MSNPIITYLRSQFKQFHDLLEATVGDTGEETANWQPQGKPATIGAQYVHILTAEDGLAHMLQGKTPLFMGEYAGKFGTDTPPPMPGWKEWAEGRHINLADARAYAQAVYAAMDAYLASLTDEDLNEVKDFGALGQMPLSAAINLLVFNSAAHTGEISALKGFQNLQGYPL
jgi:uncharacterized iron-regulated protein